MKINSDKAIINSLSVKHRVNPETVELIIDHCLKSIKDCMVMEDMPNILIHNWGRFKPNKGSLDNRFYSILNLAEKDPNKIDWHTAEYMLKAYDRIIKEDNLTSSIGADKLREIINNRNEARK